MVPPWKTVSSRRVDNKIGWNGTVELSIYKIVSVIMT